MKHNPIETVARLRRLAQDDARQALSRATAAEQAAAGRAKQAAQHIVDEADAASSITADDAMVHSFAAWLPGARLRATALRAACEHASAEVDRLRAVLTASRIATEAVEALLAQRAAARDATHARHAHAELDEIGRHAEAE